MARLKCAVEGCPNDAGLPGSARGWCRSHYHRWYRYGDVLTDIKRVPSYAGERCAHPGCVKPARSAGMCVNHYAVSNRARRRRRDPTGERRRSLEFKQRLQRQRENVLGRSRPSVCEICGESGYGRGNKPEAGICFDHDHATGVPRGWLCDRCNKVLGLVKDNHELLRYLAIYLVGHGQTHKRTA